MAYNTKTADRIREYLVKFPKLEVEEKKMFRGLTFMINGKMCLSVRKDNLMCRFDPALHEEVAEKNGFVPMIMRGRYYKGFCYVNPVAFQSNTDFEYWINLCLDYNGKARSSKKKK